MTKPQGIREPALYMKGRGVMTRSEQRGCMTDTSAHIGEKLGSQEEKLVLFKEALEKPCWRTWRRDADGDKKKKNLRDVGSKFQKSLGSLLRHSCISGRKIVVAKRKEV